MLPLSLSKCALLLLACSFVAGLDGCSMLAKRDDAASRNPPAIQYPEQIHDFGQVSEGVKLSHAFRVRNVGGEPLHIDQVRTSCGCTAALLKNNDIAPGAEGQIEVTFDTSQRGGEQRKSIVVMSNDPNHSNSTVEIRVNVEVALAFEPSFVQLQTEPGTVFTSEAWLTGKFKQQAQLRVSQKPAERELSVKIIAKEGQRGDVTSGLKFELSSKRSRFGSGQVTVDTGLAYPETLQVGYAWTVAGNIDISPVHLLFSNAPENSRERVLRITSRKADFKLKRARIVSGPFTARTEPPSADSAYQVHVSPKPGHTFTGSNLTDVGKLELISNDPLEPKREVLLKFAP